MLKLGLQKKNVAIFDSKGHVYQGRDNLDERKSEFASKKQYKNLKEALDDADIFLGLSGRGAS